MLKNIDQELTGENSVNINTGTYILIQTDFFFDNDQCTGLNLTHIKTCLNQFIDRLVVKAFLDFLSTVKWNDG